MGHLMEIIPPDCPSHLRPRLKLFLSADIVGSTPLKQPLEGPSGKFGTSSNWLAAIQSFYLNLYKSFNSEWPAENGPPPALWKTVGDEIIFWKELTRHTELHLTLRKWLKAVEIAKLSLEKFGSSLGVKCTAWTAGFPIRNKAVMSGLQSVFAADEDGFEGKPTFAEVSAKLTEAYDNPSEAHSLMDFIGPGIDTGFRLTQMATARRFIVSVDVAYILKYDGQLAPVDNRAIPDEIQVEYAGSESLKGVLGGLSYPIFYIRMPTDELDAAEDRLCRAPDTEQGAVLKFCQKFYARHASYIFEPFIVSAEEQNLTNLPEAFPDELAALVERERLGGDFTIDLSELSEDPEIPPSEALSSIEKEALKRAAGSGEDDAATKQGE